MSETIAEPGKWQPIDTAPKDGTIIDLWHRDYGRLIDVWWDRDDEFWVTGAPDHQDITHWMPMPPAPEAQP